VVTGPDAEPDLFRALRGGGGNFRVVTSMRVRLHAARYVLVGTIIYNWIKAGSVLRRYAAFAATAPDELGMDVGVMSLPNGEPVIMIVALWNGDQRQGERVMEDVQAFGTPQSTHVGPATYADRLARFDRGSRQRTPPTGRRALRAPPARSSRRRPAQRRRIARSFGTTSTAPRRGWRRMALHSACAEST
jgi:FAD/FMN-containing dehydrogenase